MLAQSPPWVGLEQRTCDAAPFNATRILATHSSLATYIAGFALAGFILLLSRTDDQRSHSAQRARANASLLLALAAINGLICSFLLSSMNGFHCLTVEASSAYATPLLIASGLLLVAGISVLAAAEPTIGNTATALRVLLLVGTVIMAGRIFLDYQNADRVGRSYTHFLDTVAVEQAGDHGAAAAGTTTALDRQLGLYAAARWPGRAAEWPSLLAHDLFARRPDGAATAGLVIVAVVGVVSALAAAISMGSAGEHGPPKPAAERWWRGWLSGCVAVLTTTSPLLFAAGVGQGERLLVPPWWHWTFGFVSTLSVMILAVQPPLVTGQRSLISASRATLRQWRAGLTGTKLEAKVD